LLLVSLISCSLQATDLKLQVISNSLEICASKLTARIKKAGRYRKVKNQIGTQTDAFYAELTSLLKLYQFRERKRRLICGLNATECYALAEVVERGPLAVQAVSEALSLDKSTGTRVVRSLERLGLVSRRVSATDYKVHAIVVT
jgi:hypothetical protein